MGSGAEARSAEARLEETVLPCRVGQGRDGGIAFTPWYRTSGSVRAVGAVSAALVGCGSEGGIGHNSSGGNSSHSYRWSNGRR